jgi:fatty-acyl-CoA synthase
VLQRLTSEFLYARGMIGALRRTEAVAHARNVTLGDYFERWADSHGNAIALESAAASITYRQLDAMANRIARWASAQGLAKGDCVALFMRNRPEYVAIWAGFARAGLATSLINTNLSGRALAYCVSIANAKAAVVDAGLSAAWDSAAPLFAAELKTFAFDGAVGDAAAFEQEIAAFSADRLTEAERPALTLDDPALYIYTSGTTGMPKAARITHSRALRIMVGFASVTRATKRDRVYLTLPMYHSNGGLIATGIAFCAGGSCFLRERFSATEFWPEVAARGCTIFVYIGELCRYLLNAPPTPQDRAHKLRLCVGNGLRPDIFTSFKNRFGIRDIVEFYAATEGNVAMFNLDSHPGAVGRVPGWAAGRFPVRIVGFDVLQNAVKRDSQGRCVVCGPNEVGEMIGEISDDPKKPAARFDGYADSKATESKILRDVFKPGDAWFRTGDLLRRDANGYYFFIDRIGDTFRWKGENVSTTEVAETISQFPGVHEAIVYGVAVPGTDGRAGMAALVVEDQPTFDLAGLRAYLIEKLPPYARPLFLRFRPALEITGTFKQKKVELVSEGYDPGRTFDPLFFDDRRVGAYVRIGADFAGRLAAGEFVV